MRPAPMFGSEDRLLNSIASKNIVITSNGMRQRMWPVHVIDVAMALEHMLHDDTTAQETYELYGPTRYSMKELFHLVNNEAWTPKRRHIRVPALPRMLLTALMNKLLWWPVGSPDEVHREFLHQVIDPKAKTFKDLNMEPSELKAHTYEYLVGGHRGDSLRANMDIRSGTAAHRTTTCPR